MSVITYKRFDCFVIISSLKGDTVKPRFTAVFGGKETSAVNRGPR